MGTMRYKQWGCTVAMPPPMLVVMSGVPTSTDVAAERKLFEQPFSVFGQPGPRFCENLETIDGRKNWEN